ncbi:MAG: heterodisulfide reductase-related iron-sulfur binding cluster [Nitrospirota bacterium]|nr:heterodisulfide reductase-related iron-sulfur binding cluster [Nitrospirota bacterium]
MWSASPGDLRAKSTAAALHGARRFSERGSQFPFSAYAYTEIAFWPGCSLAGTSPSVVRNTAALLGEHLRKDVGIVLDCCFDPLYQLGEVDSVNSAAQRIRLKLKKRGIRHVIAGCLNCLKIFRLYLPEIKVDYVLDVIPEGLINIPTNDNLKGPVYLHHPCPAYRIEGHRERANKLLVSTGRAFQESQRPQCCGLGRGMNVISPGQADALTDRIIRSAQGKAIVTYCMGCKGRLLSRRAAAFHILEFLPGVKPAEKPLSPFHYWANRLWLSLQTTLAVTEPEAYV